METSKSALGAVILNKKTGEVHHEENNEQLKIEPVKTTNYDLEARKWLIDNISTLMEMVSERLANNMVDDLTKPSYGIKLKRQVGENNSSSDHTIIIASTNKRDIDHVILFLNRLREEIRHGAKLHSIRYMLAHKKESPLHYDLEELYEFTTVVDTYEDGIPENEIYIWFERYADSLDRDLFRMLKYKTFLNLWERLAYRKELRAISAFKLWYEIEIRDDL